MNSRTTSLGRMPALFAAMLTCLSPTIVKAAGGDEGWVIAGDVLYGVDRVAGTPDTTPDPLTPEWSGATSMAYKTWLHIITGGALWRADKVHGTWILLNDDDWSGPTQMAWNKTTGKLYIIQADRLWQMTDADNSDAYTLVNNSSYSNHTSMTSLGDWLYVIRNDNLYKVNPTTGSRSVLGSAGIWTGATRMTVQTFGGGLSNGKLYVTQGGKLYQVDPTTGSRTQYGPNSWNGVTTMFCSHQGSFTSNIYIINSSRLYRVDNAGNRTDTSGQVWGGATASAGDFCFF